MAAERQSDKMPPNKNVHMKQRCGTEFLHAEKNATLAITAESEPEPNFTTDDAAPVPPPTSEITAATNMLTSDRLIKWSP